MTLDTVRRLCLALPGTEERLSHGEPTFFTGGKVFVMFANNHHGDGRVAVWLPVPSGLQPGLIAGDPERYFHPPYVGVRGWVGIVLAGLGEGTLAHHIGTAHELVTPRKKPPRAKRG